MAAPGASSGAYGISSAVWPGSEDYVCVNGYMELPGSPQEAVGVACLSPSNGSWHDVDVGLPEASAVFALTQTKYGFISTMAQFHADSMDVVVWPYGGSSTLQGVDLPISKSNAIRVTQL